MACALAAGRVAAAEPVTFSKEIAPIVFTHCAICHRPGEIAPFSLLTYRDVRQHLTQVGDATKRRVMPPWKPTPGTNQFLDDRSLSAEDIQRIQDWIAQGAPEGNPRELPSAPAWGNGWRLGTPDLIVSMPAPFLLHADGGDVFRTFVLPIPVDRMRYVRAVEFHPGNPRAVHHANMGIDRTRSSRRLDEADAEPGYVGGMVPDASYPAGYMLGWTPGQQPRPSPDGMPWRLEPNSDVVVQLHLQPTGKPEPVQVSVGFFFTEEAPVAAPAGLRLGSQTIDIPAGERRYTITDRYVIPVDVDLLAVQPHAHNLGREMYGEATLPDGKTEPLIAITDWDFRWQDVYRYVQPLSLPKGTVVSMRFVYDNSADNPRNPFQPPHRIVWGQNTSDEMGDLWLQLVPKLTADFALLAGDIAQKSRADDLAAYTKVLEADPGNPLRHDAVGLLDLQSGHADAAAARFRESLRLNPDSAPTHYNLGLALSMLRQYPDAVGEFQDAVRLDPDYAEAHNNLGALLHVSGRLDEAAVHYRRALALRPENAEAHSNLGRLLTLQGQYAAAVDEFTRGLGIAPDNPSTLAGLAWVRATAPDAAVRNAAGALEDASRAAELSGRKDASVLDTLAAAYAASGDFPHAIATAQEAMALADASGAQALWVEIRERLLLYQQGRPYLSK
jgi:Tfp pilus assembly protein PilF